MKTIRTQLPDAPIPYPLKRIGEPGRLLFIDIETTGFRAASSSLYLIGCAYHDKDGWQLVQWFADRPDEEPDLLHAFFRSAQAYDTLIHFNGSTFDLPYLLQKCRQYQFPYDFSGFTEVDLYKRISPLKSILGLESCRQQAIEAFLGTGRVDATSGGDLIRVYHDYVFHPSQDALRMLLFHNAEDMKGLLSLLPMLSYEALFGEETKALEAQVQEYRKYDGSLGLEALFCLQLPLALPKPVSFSGKGCYFSGKDQAGMLKAPVLEDELKYYYPNHKDYYYLPLEDMALHKSVASYVEKEFRRQATPATCYTRKRSRYLPQYAPLFQPSFRKDYKDKLCYFELTEGFLSDQEACGAYVRHLLGEMRRAREKGILLIR